MRASRRIHRQTAPREPDTLGVARRDEPRSVRDLDLAPREAPKARTSALDARPFARPHAHDADAAPIATLFPRSVQAPSFRPAERESGRAKGGAPASLSSDYETISEGKLPGTTCRNELVLKQPTRSSRRPIPKSLKIRQRRKRRPRNSVSILVSFRLNHPRDASNATLNTGRLQIYSSPAPFTSTLPARTAR